LVEEMKIMKMEGKSKIRNRKEKYIRERRNGSENRGTNL
jgi:hypothetical protein